MSSTEIVRVRTKDGREFVSRAAGYPAGNTAQVCYQVRRAFDLGTEVASVEVVGTGEYCEIPATNDSAAFFEGTT